MDSASRGSEVAARCGLGLAGAAVVDGWCLQAAAAMSDTASAASADPRIVASTHCDARVPCRVPHLGPMLKARLHPDFAKKVQSRDVRVLAGMR